MASLNESGGWVEGIYQLEISDPVEGGTDGKSNRPLRELAARTKWLRERIASTNYIAESLVAKQALTLNVSASSEFIITLTENVCALTLSNALPEKGTAQQVTLVLTQGTGVNKVSWPGSVRWQHGHIPVLSYIRGKTDVITLVTYDTGKTWLGFYSGAGY